MALIKVKEIKSMSLNDRGAKLRELQDELMHERGTAAMGGAPANPGRIRAIRTNIARILTVQQEEEK
jgi:large subunit ribosomal protein L29